VIIDAERMKHLPAVKACRVVGKVLLSLLMYDLGSSCVHVLPSLRRANGFWMFSGY
jgi:hypothetical protein